MKKQAHLAVSRAIFIRICQVNADPWEGPKTYTIKFSLRKSINRFVYKEKRRVC